MREDLRVYRRLLSATAVFAALSLLIASGAMGATRYAAPGGTGTDPCGNPAKPCSVFTAADKFAPATTLKAGDVVELAPGTYVVENEGEFGDLGAVTPPAGVTVRGAPGKPKPIIVVKDNETGWGAFYIRPGVLAADLEIRNRSEYGAAIGISGGTLDRVIARSWDSGEPTCYFDSGVIRSSACLSSSGHAAIGINLTAKGVFPGVIRNSTLIATGPGSVGMEFLCEAFKRGMTLTIDAVGVVVKGEEKDVIAHAFALNRGSGAIVRIDFRASDYATVEAESESHGRASVTAPGSNGNITAPPWLAAGNLRQLPGSPTIDQGAIDAGSGALDVDGQAWTTSGAADIGADELLLPSSAVNPVPATELGRTPFSQTPIRTAKFTFGSSEPGSRFECKLDGQPYRPCASPYEKKVELGGHEFRVRAVDPQGETDRTPSVFRWRLRPWRAFGR